MERNREYDGMKGMRGKDIYPDSDLERSLVSTVFPKDAEGMARRLSNVTAAFYGLALKHLGLTYGWDNVDTVSKNLFRELGHVKATEARELGVFLPPDSRAPAIVFVTAVYTSSPEYNFEFLSYKPEETALRVFGSCRYYRIAKHLSIEGHLTWPTLIPFFEGIAEELGIRCSVEMTVQSLEDDGTCDYLTRFVMRKSG
ncbi:MAG TPA: hypothetical protein DCR97_13100 [Deltaproteobacteria bacterium]|jgi:hypothetical protein|nr:hypothetical protein [Deltaproteobacteria bacterium]